MERWTLKSFVAVAVTFSVAACGGHEGGGNEKPSETRVETVTLTLSPDRETMFRNPFSGWVIYSGLGDGLSDDFWEIYDNFPSAIGKVRVSDYASDLLVRVKWSEAEPEEGLYFWDEACQTKPAQRFRMLRAGARERGLKLIFNLRVDSRDLHVDAVPAYVRAKGAEGFETTTGTSTKVWTPYPDDPVFQDLYEKFLRAFAAEFNNPDEVDWMGSWGIGLWGEYHTCIYSTGDESPREPVFDHFTDLFLDIFDRVPVCINFHRSIGTGSGSSFDPDSQRLVQKGVDKGLCLTSGAFGMHSYYSDWEKGFIHTQRWKVPIHCEGGWVKASHGNSIFGDGYADYAEVRRGEFDDARDACVNTMDFRYNSDIGSGETWSWFNEAFDLVQEAIRTQFYRLYPDRVSLPEKAPSGAVVEIGHRWNNLGWAYCPTNIKPFKGRFKLAFALLDPATGTPVHLYFDENADPSAWTHGTPVSYTSKVRLDAVEPGSYLWGVGILDTSKAETTIGIQIAAKCDKTAGGWVVLAPVTIE